MKFLQVALLFTFVMLVAHVVGKDTCKTDSDCGGLPWHSLCVPGPNGELRCTLVLNRRDSDLDRLRFG